jgi:hypothetical protein
VQNDQHWPQKGYNAMQFVPVPATVQVEIRYNQYFNNMENVLYFLYDSTVTRSAIDDILARIGLWWHDYLRARQDDSISLRDLCGTDLTVENSWVRHDSTYVGQLGTYTSGSPLPSNVTFAMSFRTEYSGRSFRGRNFLVGVNSNMISANNLQSAFEATIRGYYERLLYPSADLGTHWTWVVVSRRHNNAWREVGLATPVESVVATDLILDSQRRRLTLH